MTGEVSATHKYYPRQEQRENNLFIEEYFSGTDAKIYIDNEEQTEISYISYSIQEQLKPIYGYSSYTYDDVAVGNRVVMGSIKIPIKNTEAQTTLEELKSNNIISSNSEYNQIEQNNFNNNEWINPNNDRVFNDTIVNNNNIINDNNYYIYLSKLNAIGYNVNVNMDSVKIQSIIRDFQRNNNLEQTGSINSDTINKINDLYNNTNSQKITISIGTNIYYGPAESYDIMLVTPETMQCSIIKEYDDGWKMIQTSDGMSGYVKLDTI